MSRFEMRIHYITDISSVPDLNYPETVGVRTDGLLGDNIIASTAFRSIINNTGRPVVIFSTYNHDKRRVKLLADLYSELISEELIKSIIHYPRPHGPLQKEERDFLEKIGCEKVYDCGPFEKEFKQLQRGKPFLGKELEKELESKKKKIIL